MRAFIGICAGFSAIAVGLGSAVYAVATYSAVRDMGVYAFSQPSVHLVCLSFGVHVLFFVSLLLVATAVFRRGAAPAAARICLSVSLLSLVSAVAYEFVGNGNSFTGGYSWPAMLAAPVVLYLSAAEPRSSPRSTERL